MVTNARQSTHGDQRMATDPRRLAHGDQLTTTSSRRQTLNEIHVNIQTDVNSAEISTVVGTTQTGEIQADVVIEHG